MTEAATTTAMTATAAQHGPPARRRMPRAERERQILAVAEEVFAERGFQATSMDEVSLRVGVSKPMLYEYFGSKEGLLLASVARIRGELQEATELAVAAAADSGPRTVLKATFEAYFDFADRHGRAWAVLLNESVLVAGQAEAEIETIRRQQTGLVEGLLTRWLRGMPAERVAVYAHSLIGAGERIARWRMLERERGRERDGDAPIGVTEAAEMVVELFWPGFEAAAVIYR